jgi:hypothetical protein
MHDATLSFGSTTENDSLSMSPEDWIATWRKRHPRAGGRCAHAARALAKEFLHLEVVQGSVLIPAYKGVTFLKYVPPTPELLALPPLEASHWWCRDPQTGVIYDPTADQFTKILKYQPIE